MVKYIGEDEVDGKSIDQTVNIGWSAEQTFSGGIDLDSNNINNVETLNSSKVTTDQITINEAVGQGTPSSNQSIPSGTNTQIAIGTAVFDEAVVTVDQTNDKIILTTDGKYLITGAVEFDNDTGYSANDFVEYGIEEDGLQAQRDTAGHHGQNIHFNLAAKALVERDGTDVSVTHYCRQDSGSSQDIRPGAERTVLTVLKVT